ncbi:MAG: UDP-N-acetylmuramoyl-L-alanyl-D-glutamate--2,6-diaminopimelate ligase [bacterium]|nr:UDP-N-acetylmuramoyl-L-alanyl-D-glutamate--2,6-diaminopimelate ligase [bacterium]
MLAEIMYRLKRPYHFVKTGLLNGLPGQIKAGFPGRKLKILAITGTDGKTTSSTLLYHILKNAGKKVGLITTVAAYVGDDALDTGFHVTSPQPADVQKLMKQMVKDGYEYLILEVTSHGLYQYRTWGIQPLLAGLTNISNEHLDYHITYENYIEAKALLFKKAKVVVLNQDDPSYHRLRKLLRNRQIQVVDYSRSDRLPRRVQQAVSDRFPEAFNQMNARLIWAVSEVMGVESGDFADAIATFPGVVGRMQLVKTSKRKTVFIDFAHTPKALRESLISMRRYMKDNQLSGQLIAIFGCAGLRDRSKRPEMARIAVELADIVILTAEDPRTEDVWSIIREMKDGLSSGHDKIMTIVDRSQAITMALTIATSKDVVGVMGKGHEKSMCYGKIEYPWSDEAAVHESLSRL